MSDVPTLHGAFPGSAYYLLLLGGHSLSGHLPSSVLCRLARLTLLLNLSVMALLGLYWMQGVLLSLLPLSTIMV